MKVYGFSGIIYAGFLQRGGGKSPLPPTEEGDMDEGGGINDEGVMAVMQGRGLLLDEG